jgi:hypothetical protein
MRHLRFESTGRIPAAVGNGNPDLNKTLNDSRKKNPKWNLNPSTRRNLNSLKKASRLGATAGGGASMTAVRWINPGGTDQSMFEFS